MIYRGGIPGSGTTKKEISEFLISISFCGVSCLLVTVWLSAHHHACAEELGLGTAGRLGQKALEGTFFSS